jgi:hypothetical protein
VTFFYATNLAKNLNEGLPDKSKLVQHTYDEGNKAGWDGARILEIESNDKYRKYNRPIWHAQPIRSANPV